MSMKPKIIYRGKLAYVLYENSVTVGAVEGIPQWSTYNQYNNWNRQGITKYKETIFKSKPDEYTTYVEQMSLAVRCGIKGTGTSRPKELKEKEKLQ